MELEALGGETNIKNLIHNIRSVDETERESTISQIPTLILESFKQKSDILNQLLLVIYNLNTDSDNYEILNANNRTLVIRHLLRLYAETISNHNHNQIAALKELVDIVNSSELLMELAYVLHKCSSSNLGEEETNLANEAMIVIQEKASAGLYPEALLMIHSILALKENPET